VWAASRIPKAKETPTKMLSMTRRSMLHHQEMGLVTDRVRSLGALMTNQASARRSNCAQLRAKNAIGTLAALLGRVAANDDSFGAETKVADPKHVFVVKTRHDGALPPAANDLTDLRLADD
jgi:hypothetical protein